MKNNTETEKAGQSSIATLVDARPNKQLSVEEKLAKRNLKRHLKQRTRIRKYEMRWTQACERKDERVKSLASQELRDYLTQLESEKDSIWYQPDFPSEYRDFWDDPGAVVVPIQQDTSNSSAISNIRVWMAKEIWQKLIDRMLPDTLPPSRRPLPKDNASCKEHSSDHPQPAGRSEKLEQTMQARSLLDHMTKGTQQESMFENDAALIGYTRQKFMERALLAVKSLQQLRGGPLRESLMQIQSIISIGCGPGCDAVGVLTFLRNVGGRKEGSVLDRLVLMDFVMPRWKRLVLDHLHPVICAKFVNTVEMTSCDVRYSLKYERNSIASDCLASGQIDFVVVSYLLTETRGLWKDFFQCLLSSLTKECLFLMSEPTAWQLHSFINHFEEFIVEKQWLDSSQHSPDLQSLEGRLGPAVVLIRIQPKLSDERNG